jgi:hypothetical protein
MRREIFISIYITLTFDEQNLKPIIYAELQNVYEAIQLCLFIVVFLWTLLLVYKNFNC